MSFPASLDNITTVSTGQLITSAYVNSQTNAINNIEKAVGLNPARALAEGRLSLSATAPVSITDVSGSTIYFQPMDGQRIALFDGIDTWKVHAFGTGDLSIPLSGLTNNKNYDVFCYDNSGTPTLELGSAWTSDSARATDLAVQDGILVKSGGTTRRYLGTFRTTSTSTTEDSAANRFLFNIQNPIMRHFAAQNVSSVTSTSSSWAAVASTTGSILIGVARGSISFSAIANAGSHSTSSTLSSFGAGLNGVAPDTNAYTSVHAPASSSDFSFSSPVVMAYPSLGLNTVQAYAKTAASTLTMINPGISGSVEM